MVRIRCNDCEDGVVEVQVDVDRFDARPCEKCGGSGGIWVDWFCPYCGEHGDGAAPGCCPMCGGAVCTETGE